MLEGKSSCKVGKREDWFLEGGVIGGNTGEGARKTGLSLRRGPQRSQVFQVASVGWKEKGFPPNRQG